MATIPIGDVVTASVRRTHRGRLFRKYLLLILTLVTGALLASGAISIYFAYQENKTAVASLQHEKALAAASRIEQYIRQIEQQLAYAALPQLDASDIETRRIEFLKLLRQAPEVTDVSQIDASGHEQIAVSRLGMDNINSGKDRSQEPAFLNARRGQTWFGPVYFRKETEPYMTMSLRPGGDKGPVTVAEVNLKFIWDVVSRIKIGEKGKAYVVDDHGFLVADPDIGLVLRKTDLAHLPHVAAAIAAQRPVDPTMVSADLAGTKVLTSVAPIDSLHWNVFVEQPVSEVYEKLNASILRTGLLLLAGMVISAVAALALARGMVRPIRTLSDGAQRIGAGELDQKIDVHTGDELETLADRFNHMTSQLRESYAGLERKVDERTRELKNSLDQQTAISEVLRVISSSPGDVKPMLSAVAERALKLCEAVQSTIILRDGDKLRAAAHVGNAPPMADGEFLPLNRGSVSGRAIIDRTVIHLDDLASAPEDEFPIGRELQRRLGSHAILGVPLMREDRAIGAITLWRMEARRFTDKQIALVKTFADQAAIAIENVRLFNETKEGLEQQTAISEVLRVISSSPGDVKPMLDAVAERALNLCGAAQSGIFLVEQDLLRYAARFGSMLTPEDNYSVPLSRGLAVGRAILDRKTIHHADIVPLLENEYPDAREPQRKYGFRALLAVPLMREDRAIGAIVLWRTEPMAFTDKQIKLVGTFADQAAIAIENVRLFNETKEGLEQQTAIAEILRVISSSPTDVQPTLDAIAERAARLCDAASASMHLIEGNMLRHHAAQGPLAEPITQIEPLPIDRDTISGCAILDRKTMHITDMLADGSKYPRSFELSQRHGHRTVVVVPLFREGRPFGTLLVRRQEVRPFSDREIALLQTFGDQAAIALENVRLFNETKEALEQQRASGDVLAAISSSIADTKPVFDKILQSCERLFAGKLAGINLVGDDGLLRLVAYHGPDREKFDYEPRLPDDTTATGRAFETRSVQHYPDLEHGPNVPEGARIGLKGGMKSSMHAPMLWEGKGIGTIWVARDYVGQFSEKEIALLKTFADQAVIAIQNARLFREIQEKSQQLEVANKHKSEFLANMSHELRTPLNAIIGFSEVLVERLFGDLNEKQADYLKDIHSSGIHLLTLINDILDLSKVEAGRMELEPTTFEISAAVSNAMTLVRERAQRHGILLGQQIDAKLGDIVADERKFKQILVNLLSNAVKFTPDGGRIDVLATREDSNAVIAVQDTGIGIAPEDQAAVFEEFRQVGRDYTKKQEGTGLGLALTKKFVELHGGRIWVQSKPGEGSTFTFTIPLQR